MNPRHDLQHPLLWFLVWKKIKGRKKHENKSTSDNSKKTSKLTTHFPPLRYTPSLVGETASNFLGQPQITGQSHCTALIWSQLTFSNLPPLAESFAFEQENMATTSFPVRKFNWCESECWKKRSKTPLDGFVDKQNSRFLPTFRKNTTTFSDVFSVKKYQQISIRSKIDYRKNSSVASKDNLVGGNLPQIEVKLPKIFELPPPRNWRSRVSSLYTLVRLPARSWIRVVGGGYLTFLGAILGRFSEGIF